MSSQLKRIYKEPDSKDGYRVLVDKLWPRGLSKDDAKLDDWMKDIAPSDQLRKSYHNETTTWNEFRRAYLAELKQYREELRPLAERARNENVTLLFSSSNAEHNNAVVVQQYLKMLD